MTRLLAAFISLLAAFSISAHAQESGESASPTFESVLESLTEKFTDNAPSLERNILGQSKIVSVDLANEVFNYRLTVEQLGIFDRHDVIPPADVAAFAYESETLSENTERPVIFAFNGGPGSASLWLHMGAWGPQRIERGGTKTEFGEPPYDLEPNPGFLIDVADIVFVDPVNTGLSKPRNNSHENIVTYSSLRRDARGNCLFVKNWLKSRNQEDRPVFFAGESYGSLRVAAMAVHPICRRQRFNLHGLIMVSGLMDLPARADRTERIVEAFPTYAALAWFHGKVDKGVYGNDLEKYLSAAQNLAIGDLGPAFFQRGFAEPDIVSAAQKRACRFLGFEGDIGIEIENGGVTKTGCVAFLVAATPESFSPCRYDGRFNCKGVRNGYPYYPPGLDGLGEEFVRHLRKHVLDASGFDIGEDFKWRGPSISHRNWDWGYQPNDWGQGVNMADRLTPLPMTARLRLLNRSRRRIRVLSLSGTYDLITPYFGMKRAFIRAGVPFEHINYEAGHMMYMDRDIAIKLADDVRRFITID